MYSLKENVKESFRLAWKYKILWIFALLISIGGGGGRGGVGGGSSSDNQEFTFPTDSTPDSNMETVMPSPEVNSPEEKPSPFANMVMGASDMAKDVMTPESTPTAGSSLASKIILGGFVVVSFISFLVYTIYVFIMVRMWAKGALISGTKAGQEGAEKLDLFSLSKSGLSSMRRLFSLSITIALYIMGALLLMIVPVLVAVIIKNTIVSLVVSLVMLLLVIYIIVKLIFGSFYAERYIVLHNLQVKEGLKKGIGSFKNSKKHTLSLAAANTLILMLGGGVIFGVFGALAFFVYRNSGGLETHFTPLIFLLATPLLIAVFIGLQVLVSFFGTYRQFTWTRLFLYMESLHIENKDKEVKKVEGAQA